MVRSAEHGHCQEFRKNKVSPTKIEQSIKIREVCLRVVFKGTIERQEDLYSTASGQPLRRDPSSARPTAEEARRRLRESDRGFRVR